MQQPNEQENLKPGVQAFFNIIKHWKDSSPQQKGFVYIEYWCRTEFVIRIRFSMKQDAPQARLMT
jgi:hypothetical protein